jgi:hypothetical protein
MLNVLDESGGAGVGATHGSLHTAYSTTGANEVTGGSPAYARKAATWAAASGRSKATSAGMAFDVPAGTTVRWCGLYDALTVGNFLGMVPNGGGVPQPFSVNATGVTANTLDAPSHGFSAGNSVVVWAANPAEPLPTPLAEGTVYWVIATGLTTDAFQLSATSGGSAIDLTAAGAGFAQRIVEEVFGAQGTHTVTTATMTLD